MPLKVILSIFFSDLKLLFARTRNPRFQKGGTSSVSLLFSPASNTYLTKLRNQFRLEEIVAGKTTDADRLVAVATWVSKLWDHNGWNEPSQRDPISIIEEAQAGKSFRCVEYAIVLAGTLTALGYPSRTLGLMTQDVETRKYGAGHLVVEAFLPEQNTWAMVDGQFGALATVNGAPASAAVYAEALHSDPDSASGLSGLEFNPKRYKKWIKPYLYYLSAKLDNRYDEEPGPDNSICLGPLQAPNPKSFQGINSLNYKIYTHLMDDFYPGVDRIGYE